MLKFQLESEIGNFERIGDVQKLIKFGANEIFLPIDYCCNVCSITFRVATVCDCLVQ